MSALALALALALPAAAAEWHAVKGSTLHALFSDKEFADGVHFAYQLKRDGTFTGTEMGKPVSGTWRVARDQLCWTWRRPTGSHECYDVQREGANIRLLINGSEAWSGALK